MAAADAQVRQALAWVLRDLDGMQLASHSGGDPGAASVVCVDTASKTAVLAFSNISADREFRSFQKEVVQRLLARANETIKK